MPEPCRTCIGCREKARKSALVRLVWQPDSATGGGRVVADRDQRAPGRGAYVHPAADCINAANRRRAIGRALRITGAPLRLDLELQPPTPG